MARGKGKGSALERELCKELSLWWAGREDIFTRTAGSGARSTVRHRQGKSTANSEGDIGLLDPIGQHFLQNCVIEAKRGYAQYSLQDALDLPERNKPLIGEFWSQACRSAQQKNEMFGTSAVPILITRKDQHVTLWIMENSDFGIVQTRMRENFPHPSLSLFVQTLRGYNLTAVRFSDFLRWCDPAVFVRPLRKKESK